MKQLKFILALFFFSMVIVKSQAQTDITACFTDPNFKAAVYSKIRKFEYEPILIEDVMYITSLNVDNRAISSMAGIEYFSSLQSLDCSNNRLTALDVSNLTNLQFLYCSYNRLIALDVSKLTNLQNFNCSDNNLFSLDVSGLNRLIWLNCTSNYLPTDPAGYDPQAGIYYQFYPQKTPQNITVYFTDPNFKAAVSNRIGKNGQEQIFDTDVMRIFDLNVEGSTISSLDGIEYFINLQSLNCSRNLLTTLDVSTLANLSDLDCNNNLLNALDISGLNRLAKLDCKLNYLATAPAGYDPRITSNYTFAPQRTPDITACFTDPYFRMAVYNEIGKSEQDPILIEDVIYITRLDVSSRNISSLAGIEYFRSLQSLYCSNNQLAKFDVSDLTNLQDFYCSNNQLTVLDVSNLTNLQTLDCSNNQLTALDVLNSIDLLHLDCYNNNLFSLDVSGLNRLYWLDCRENYLSVDPAGYDPQAGIYYQFHPQKTPQDITYHFYDPNFRTAVYNRIGKNEQEQIYNTDVMKIPDLSISGRNISSLYGIEYFISLQSLDCSNNTLSWNNFSDDVSKLTNLQTLDCSNNRLSSLDVSKLTNLQTLDCSNNRLSSLDVSSLTNLIELYCRHNNLSSLDILGLGRLTRLDCRLNYLTTDPAGYDPRITSNYTFIPQKTQDITACFTDPNFREDVYNVIGKSEQNPILIEDVIDIDFLNVYGRNISSLDGIEYFLNLYHFDCRYNQLSSLDVSNLTNLQYLYCDGNQLSSLDVSNLTNLIEFYCNYNSLTTLDVSSLTNLSSLSCGDNQLSSLDVSSLTNLQYLYCYYNRLTALDVSDCPNLQYLYCQENDISYLDISKLNYLSWLNCSRNYLTKDPVGYNSATTTYYIFEPQKNAAVSLNKTNITLYIHETEQLTAIIESEDAENKNVSWSSSNASVATVSASGLITAVGEGTATITSNYLGKDAICVVEVRKISTWIANASTDWNNAANWDQGVPSATSKVIIPKGASYPILTAKATVDEILFKPGAELGRQDLLTYDKAYVQLDFNASSSRNRWWMLANPLQEMYVGDLSFGGLPGMDIRQFGQDNSGKGAWKSLEYNDKLAAGDNFHFWLAEDHPTKTAKGLRHPHANGVITLPHFENTNAAHVHWTHKYNADANQSTFYGWKKNEHGYPEQDENSAVTVKRDLDKAYKLAEGNSFTKELDFGHGVNGTAHFAAAGNPFMSSISFEKLQEQNASLIGESYWVWVGAGANNSSNPGGYVVYNKIGGTLGNTGIVLTDILVPMQSFIVERQAESSNTQIAFNIATISATGKSDGAGLRASAPASDLLEIIASTPQSAVRAVIASREEGSRIFNGKDSRRFSAGVNTLPDIYMLKPASDNSMVAVVANILNEIKEEITIPLAIATTYEGRISLSFTGMDSYNARIFLIDTDAPDKKETELTGQSRYEYTFNYVPKKENGTVAANENRFFIRLSPASQTGINPAVASNMLIYSRHANEIQVVSGELLQQVSIFNLQGQKIYDQASVDAYEHTVSGLPAGVYVVRAFGKQAVKTTKIIIK